MNIRLVCIWAVSYTHLGVHIPAEKKEDAEVTSLMSRTKKQFNVFNNINIVLSIVICGICVVNMIISIFIYILWIFVYTVGIQLIVDVYKRQTPRNALANAIPAIVEAVAICSLALAS